MIAQKFAAWHRYDRNAILFYVVLILGVIVAGFGRDMALAYGMGKLHYPLMVHLHAIAFTGWLVLFGTQTALVRTGNRHIHQRLGGAALVLLPLMLVLGPAAAITSNSLRYSASRTTFPFMATQFTNVISASALIVAGLIARKSPAAHKRLMLMATIALTEPGLTRLYPDPWGPYFELGPWHFLIMDYAGTMLLMLGVGAYDLVTRRRLHPAYVFAAIWILANEITASWLYNQPWWAHLTTRLVGH